MAWVGADTRAPRATPDADKQRPHYGRGVVFGDRWSRLSNKRNTGFMRPMSDCIKAPSIVGTPLVCVLGQSGVVWLALVIVNHLAEQLQGDAQRQDRQRVDAQLDHRLVEILAFDRFNREPGAD